MNYEQMATDEVLKKTVNALKTNGVEAEVVETKEEALEKIKSYIPAGASVMNGSSRTLEQVGYVDYLKSGKHPWNNLHAGILAETDAAKQAVLRKQSVISDFYLGSVHALTEDGQMVIASNTGSQLPHIVFTSQNLIFVVGSQKIAANLDEALTRLEKYVFPLEDARMKSVGYGGSQISKLLIFKKENPIMGRKVRVIFVKEELGF